MQPHSASLAFRRRQRETGVVLSVFGCPEPMPLWIRHMQQPRAGFRRRNLVVYAVQYELASTPPSWLIVWLDSDGDTLHPWVRTAVAGRWIVATKPGDVIVHHGEPKTVVGVAVYRALGVEPGTEVVG